MPVQKVLVIYNVKRAYAVKTEGLLRIAAERMGVSYKSVQTTGAPSPMPHIFPGEADMIIACGGDGTILEAAHRSYGSNIPIAGVNAGYLGYLSAFPADSKDFQKKLRELLNGRYILEERSVLVNRLGWALNEVVIKRVDTCALLAVQLRINNLHAFDYRCNGLILATPTGSTAYALAAGGPIVSGSAKSIIVTPICPHSLGNRPLVLGPSDEIEIIIDSGKAQVDVDGCRVGNVRKLKCRVGNVTVPLVSLPTTNRYNVLSTKLGWTPCQN